MRQVWGVENRLPSKSAEGAEVSDRPGSELILYCVQTDHMSSIVPSIGVLKEEIPLIIQVLLINR
jgi:hypothetical protein